MATGRQSGFPAAVRYPSLQSNGSDLALVPYAQVGGEWTVPDGTVLHLAARAQSEGVLREVFLDSGIRSPADFLAMLKSPEQIPVLIFAGVECVGAAWLNGVIARRAFGHFLFVKGGRGEIAREAGRLVLDYWRSFGAFDVILGLVPSVNERAIGYVQELGFVRVGEIPKVMHGRAATILYLTG